MDLTLADQEKRWAALASVVAALGLTGMKVVVGIITGSLGILAEAAHSGLDLVAALVTYLAVRYSSKPADSGHLYGHGKVENLSALFETLLLLATCVWIIHEAIDRLFVKEVEVSASVWAFLVMVISIVVDRYRSAHLYQAARKYNSQALEADALHFSTDIWSSFVVILGLGGVKLAQIFPGISVIKHADAVAALGVAVIVIYVSMELLTRSLQGLLDAAPQGMAEKIKKEVENLPEVIDCHNVRVRYSGPHLFVDIHVLMDGNLTLDEAHAITEQVEESIREKFTDADVSVHPEPRVVK